MACVLHLLTPLDRCQCALHKTELGTFAGSPLEDGQDAHLIFNVFASVVALDRDL